jgi:hydroxyacylglutathione hydrolase
MIGSLTLRVKMKLRENLYIYPWLNPEYNNANSYIISSEGVNVLIDPGHLAFIPELLREMRRDNFYGKDITLVLCTHLHPDHFEGVEFFKGSLLGFHEEEERALKEFYGPYLFQASGSRLPAKEADLYLKEGELQFGKEVWKVIHTPGHSPGSICLYNPRDKILITGDVVFLGGVGRTDLGGDPQLLARSIRRLMELEVEYLLPGHGEILVGKEAVKRNFQWIERMILPLLL